MSLDPRHGIGMHAPSTGETPPPEYIVETLDEALEHGYIKPYFQPVVRTFTGRLCGFEALARWEDPVYGLVAPIDFVPALEEARLIHKVDCHIVQQICRQYAECARRGDVTVPVSFNLSRLDFDLCDIFGVIEEAVRRYEVPRRMLNIEITETVFGTDPDFMARMVRQFHDVGYQVWMDDFGSGYSTLNALKDFDFDELKLDMEFLNRFGDKSKVILASVVDMAKKLGIQTLAEGVESEEHRDYLLRIGCEKMQGFLYGKPLPYDFDRIREMKRTMGVESTADRRYMNAIGSVNTLSLSERDFSAGSSMGDYVTSMPLAIVEFENDRFTIMQANRVFREGLQNVGIDTVEEAERRINDPHRHLAQTSRKLVDTIETDRYARLDYIVGNITCVMRARFIASEGNKKALLISIDDTIGQSERRRHDRMNDALSVLYSIYEHVDIIHLDARYIELVFSNTGLHAQFDAPDFDSVTRVFAEAEVFPADRQRYMAFMEHSTMIDRIRESGENYLVDFFRLRHRSGDYMWKLVGLIRLTDCEDNQVLYCVRSTHWANDGLFQHAYGDSADMDWGDIYHADERLSDGSLWRAIAREANLALFWKDRDRRFLGANRAFLDYYGFESVDAILGKTDEEMGWHIDPTPFRNDELRVLNEGVSTTDVLGQCIVRGEVRDIVATKRPVYRNARIVGLVGYFFDMANRQGADETIDLPMHDPVTGVLNFTGLESATWRFVDAYVKLGVDFAMISINLENYRHINEEFGYEFGDKVLRRVADELREVAGHRHAIGHVYAERFVILVQEATDEELQQICDDIERRLSEITRIDQTRCTVYGYANFARYSEHRDIEAMKQHNRDARVARHGEWPKDSSEGDVVTSTLL